MCHDARIRYWEEEWLSKLLAEAIRLKSESPPVEAEETVEDDLAISGGSTGAKNIL
ncbi:MAG TPA: hypothetical protein VMY17_01745 [Thermoplasmata archaeon]|jgi:hypothetical protein|nr:hypothetical protein [Thermoplasmata archaeon]